MMFWIKLVLGVIAFCIEYNIVKEEKFKAIVAYNIIFSIILISFDIYNRLSIPVILIYLIIIVAKSFINSFIQIWVCRLTSGFLGYLLVIYVINSVLEVLINIFTNWIFLKFLL